MSSSCHSLPFDIRKYTFTWEIGKQIILVSTVNSTGMKFAVPIWTALKIYIYNEYMYFNSMYENPYGKCGRFDIATKGMHGLATFM